MTHFMRCMLLCQGYGNPGNVKRTVKKYAQMGMSGIMIEDQVSPKRCGHTVGKQVGNPLGCSTAIWKYRY
jgi:2-methylisocitrate lyase-like PEP mutase family enzyme